MEKNMPTASQKALALVQSNIVLAIKVATLAIAITTFYFQDLAIALTNSLNDEATSYILLVPLLFAYFVYRKRKMLRASIGFIGEKRLDYTQQFGTISGILLCTTAIMLYWYASDAFTPLQYHLLTLPIFTAGLTLILFNPQTLRQALFPIIFLIFMTPPPSEILYSIGAALSVLSSEVSNSLVSFLGVHSTLISELGIPTIEIVRSDSSKLYFAVAIPCSGIYSLIGFLVFSAFVAYIVRDKLWKKLAIFLIGFPLIYSLNVLRITFMLLIGYEWGQQLALDTFHLFGGWLLIFVGTLILLVTSERIFRTRIFTRKQLQPNCSDCAQQLPGERQIFCSTCGKLVEYPQALFKKADLLKILTIILITVSLFSIQAPVYALTRGPAQILIQTPQGEQGNTMILPEIQGYALQFMLRDRDFEMASGQDLSLIYEYTSQGQGRTVFAAFEIAGTTASLHPWDACLISWQVLHGRQPLVTQLDLRDVQILKNPTITARYFAFQYPNDSQIELVLYWFENTIFTINNSSQQKYVEISLVTYLERPEELSAAENDLFLFATAMANHWEPIKKWTVVAMFLNENSLTFVTSTVALLTFFVILYIGEIVRRRKTNIIAYQKLGKPKQQLLEIMKEKSTLAQIATAYSRVTGESTTSEHIQKRIADLEKTGVVETRIVNNQDEPRKVWRPQILSVIRKP